MPHGTVSIVPNLYRGTWVRRGGTKLVRFRSEAAVRVGLIFKKEKNMPKRSWEIGMLVRVKFQGVSQTGKIVGYDENRDEYIVELETNKQKIHVRAAALN